MTAEARSRFHYVLAVAILAASGVLLQTAKGRGVLQLIKKPLPIRKALEDMDRGCLEPFSVLVSQRLPAEMVEELGTTEYIDWLLQAPRGGLGLRAAHLSVTYYTEVQDQVPHVPEECLYQAAFTPDGDDTLQADMRRLGRKISIRRLAFDPPHPTGEKTYVYYTICVNGDFYTDRQRVRVRMADPRESHLYYSKVELTFEALDPRSLVQADQQAFEVLDKVLAELAKSHWPQAGAGRGESAYGTGGVVAGGLAARARGTVPSS
jgi:hypothetical protein